MFNLQKSCNWEFTQFTNFRDRLCRVLYKDGGLVSRGSHDFWITYRVPDAPDMDSNHSREDIGISDWVTRRPMRGMVYMKLPGDNSDDTMVAQVGTLLQEVGHHWLVPRDLRFRSPHGTASRKRSYINGKY